MSRLQTMRVRPRGMGDSTASQVYTLATLPAQLMLNPVSTLYSVYQNPAAYGNVTSAFYDAATGNYDWQNFFGRLSPDQINAINANINAGAAQACRGNPDPNCVASFIAATPKATTAAAGPALTVGGAVSDSLSNLLAGLSIPGTGESPIDWTEILVVLALLVGGGIILVKVL